ncbi:hypothetical protein CHRY9293_02033 [Chryseobacterium potabilaquae]|uniref:Uncharacterized protein n=2 Tax=Chryseobacterium potabilaquae TaxID=2675057 RepID=A0A6N4X8P3_9FLAO|nr:hypothetical protein CHRY9293_02033 [Chryseobacterium potabilaquae]
MMTKERYLEKSKEAKKRGLQKFTDSEFLDRLLKQDKIGNNDLNKLTSKQLILFNDFFAKNYNEAKDEAKDQLLNKVIDSLPEKKRNQIWEVNHCNIMNAIMDYVETCGAMPTKSRIAEYTGLSRPTIDKHLKEFQNNPLFKGIDEQFKFMIPKVMGEVLRQSIKGDIRAARLFLEYAGGTKGQSRIKNQNNFIQINGIELTEEKISKLRPEQLQTIEAVLQSLD